jgi:hypothetical protein
VLVYWDFHAGGLFLCPAPFLWGMVSGLSSPLLSVCCHGSLFVFQFCRVFWLWMLLIGSGDDFVIGYLPCFREWLINCWLSVFLPFQHLFTDSSAEISSLTLPLSLVHFQQSCPFHCLLDYSLLFIVQFFGSRGSVCPGAVLVCPRDGWGNSA